MPQEPEPRASPSNFPGAGGVSQTFRASDVPPGLTFGPAPGPARGAPETLAAVLPPGVGFGLVRVRPASPGGCLGAD